MYTPQRTTVRFAVVSITRTFRWRDEDGKKHQKSQRFMQTINPYNKNAKGEPKGREEIMRELTAAASLWQLKMENDFRDSRTAA